MAGERRMIVERQRDPALAATLLRANRCEERIIRLYRLHPARGDQVTINRHFGRAGQLGNVLLSAFAFAMKVIAPPLPPFTAWFDNHTLLNVAPTQTGDLLAAARCPEIEQENGPVAQTFHGIRGDRGKKTVKLLVREGAIDAIRASLANAERWTGRAQQRLWATIGVGNRERGGEAIT